MTPPRRLHVSLLALPEASVSVLYGMHDLLNAFTVMQGMVAAIPAQPPFKVELVGMAAGQLALAGGTPVQVHRGLHEVTVTDIVIVPALVTDNWQTGRYPEMVAWLKAAHARGAVICSACSGALLIAETGLLDGQKTTVHWSYARNFKTLYPQVPLNPEKTLLVAGDRQQFVSCGASMSWHDLALYLVARHVGPEAAQAVAKFFALQWHRDGLGPFMAFEGRRDHGDAAILAAQTWLDSHFQVGDPVEQMVSLSGVAERSFKRRFSKATGHAPLDYVQRLRIEEAKRRLERAADPVDEISWQVGYEDPGFFRRLFKRVTGISPGHYRRQFKIPDFAPPHPPL